MKFDLKTIRDRCEEDGDCWIWKQSVNSAGYPQARRGQLVRRIALGLSGKPPRPRMVCVASCRERLCCNPAHLSWLPRAGLPITEKQRGTYSNYTTYLRQVSGKKKTKLDWAKVRVIRQRLAAGVKPAEIAVEFGVGRTTISAIKQGQSWRLPDTHFMMKEAA
jgi:hypothetical protein